MQKTVKRILTTLGVIAGLVIALLRPAFEYPAPAATNQPEASASETAQTTATTTPQPATSEPQQQTASASSSLSGIDVSHYQGTVDWPTVAANGISFAFAKASDGITYVDPQWTNNVTNATAAGVPIGGYHFYEPNDDPISQADHFLSVLGDDPGQLPPVVDLEKSPASGSEDSYLNDVISFLQAVQSQSNCQPIVYASRSFWTEYLASGLSDYPLWLAEYATTPNPPDGKTWLFWQNSQNGTVSGIDGAVDLDVFSGSPSDLTDLFCTQGGS